MNNLKSEVLFNRALIWLVMEKVTEETPLRALFLVCAIWNIWRSCKEVK